MGTDMIDNAHNDSADLKDLSDIEGWQNFADGIKNGLESDALTNHDDTWLLLGDMAKSDAFLEIMQKTDTFAGKSFNDLEVVKNALTNNDGPDKLIDDAELSAITDWFEDPVNGFIKETTSISDIILAIFSVIVMCICVGSFIYYCHHWSSKRRSLYCGE